LSRGLEERRRREQLGRDAEEQAAAFLIAQGYDIIARRLRTPGGEVDLIAHQAPVLAFVEVKARASVGRGMPSLSERQAARIAAAAEFFLAENEGYEDTYMRLDLIVVTPGAAPHHFPNAWQVDG
jgi:putative endonuclease